MFKGLSVKQITKFFFLQGDNLTLKPMPYLLKRRDNRRCKTNTLTRRMNNRVVSKDFATKEQQIYYRS